MYQDENFNSENYSISARYKTVRKRLDSLGYKYILSVDTLPLVEQLLVDLIQTTESLKHYKSIAQDKIDTRGSHEALSIDPYKCDNVRLIKECNQLHSDLIESKEINLKQTKELKRKINRLESECNDLQLASSRNLKRIKDLELESSNKSKRIQELLGKCCKPTISNAGLGVKRRNCFPLRRPVFSGEPLSGDALRGSSSLPSLSKTNPETINLVGMADRKINALNYEVNKLRGDMAMQEENVHTLQSQLGMKEKEVSRLRKMLEGDRQYAALSKDCSCRKTEPNQSTYRKTAGSFVPSGCLKASDFNEIKILQQAKLNLEQQLRDALDKQHDAMSKAMKLADRNEELEKELRDIDHIALAVEADCNTTVKENNRRVSHLQEKIETMSTQVRELEANLMEEKRSSQELKAEFEACKIEKRNIQRTLDSTIEDKKKLTERINQLTLIEKSLNDEIDKLSRQNETQKHEILHLESATGSLKKQMTGQRRSFSPPVHEKDSGIDEKAKKIINEKERMIADLQLERDRFKNELEKIKNQQEDFDNAEMLCQIRDLKSQLSEKEHRIMELQREKRDVCREKISIESRLQSARSHGHSPCDACSHCRSVGPCVCRPVTPDHGGPSKLVLARLERERDSARADVERLTEERDILRERLKIATGAHTSEQRRLKDSLNALEIRLAEAEREKQEMYHAQGTRRSAITGLESDLEDAREELRRTKQELTSQRTQYFQLRTLQDQTDQALGDVQTQLNQSETELSKAIDRNRCLEQKQIQLDTQVKDLKQEVNTLRSNMARLDQEKDQLLMDLDVKTEKIATLEREVSLREQQTLGVEQQLRDLQHKNQICLGHSAEQERQMRSMQLEMENNQRQLAAASADRDNAAQENRRLQDDIAAVTCEFKSLRKELEASKAESHDLKRQMQFYVSEVRRAEDLLNRKENERTEMLNHYRSLSLEATVLENNNHSLESEASEAKSALQEARDRLLDYERQCADKDCLIRGYESQIHELTQNVASLELQIRQQCEQRSRTEADLNAVRDLCVKLDQQKENLMKDINEKDVLCARYEAQISHLKAEQNMIQDQITRDHAAVGRLETMLDQSRRECMDTQAANQELHNEISRLKEKACELQNKLSSEAAELRRYQNQAAEYSKQISDLRRQATNERFDRARKEEENRRNYSYSGETTGCPDDCGPPPPPIPSLPTSPAIVRFDTSRAVSTPHRYNQNSVIEKSRSSSGQNQSILEARQSNRFAPNDTYKDLQLREEQRITPEVLAAPLEVHDTSMKKNVSVHNCSPLCVKATLEEGERYKDIKLEITDASSGNRAGVEELSRSTASIKTCNRTFCKAFNDKKSLTNETIVDDGKSENLKDKKKKKTTMSEEKFSIKECGCDRGKGGRLGGCPENVNEEKSKNRSKKNESKKNKIELSKNKSTNNDSNNNNNNNNNNKFDMSSLLDSGDDAVSVGDLTDPNLISMLVEIRDGAETLNQEMSTMNRKMLSGLLGHHENSRFNKTTYERVEEIEDVSDALEDKSENTSGTEDFQPLLSSTKNNLLDLNDNEITISKSTSKSRNCKSKLPIVINREIKYSIKNSPSSNSQSVKEIINEKSIIEIDDPQRGKMRISSAPERNRQRGKMIKKTLEPRQLKEIPHSSASTSPSDPKRPRLDKLTMKKLFKEREKSESKSIPSGSKSVYTQDPPLVFYDLPEDDSVLGFSTTERSLGSYRFSEPSGQHSSIKQTPKRHRNCQAPCSSKKY